MTWLLLHVAAAFHFHPEHHAAKASAGAMDAHAACSHGHPAPATPEDDSDPDDPDACGLCHVLLHGVHHGFVPAEALLYLNPASCPCAAAMAWIPAGVSSLLPPGRAPPRLAA